MDAWVDPLLSICMSWKYQLYAACGTCITLLEALDPSTLSVRQASVWQIFSWALSTICWFVLVVEMWPEDRGTVSLSFTLVLQLLVCRQGDLEMLSSTLGQHFGYPSLCICRYIPLSSSFWREFSGGINLRELVNKRVFYFLVKITILDSIKSDGLDSSIPLPASCGINILEISFSCLKFLNGFSMKCI